ncbi:MAG: hypothetical protein WBL63_26480 [Candidatus Acidiferrum sp.]
MNLLLFVVDVLSDFRSSASLIPDRRGTENLNAKDANAAEPIATE